ncbi:MAG: hypothetical protein J0L59_01675 [Xanthomonadales bacterium]|nr:hypothetical protein [Xanthomonadales bacterium]
MPCCMYCKRETTEAHALRVIYNHHSLHADWTGWRMAGRWLVSPIGERIDASELLAILRTRKTERLKAVSSSAVSKRPIRPCHRPPQIRTMMRHQRQERAQVEPRP